MSVRIVVNYREVGRLLKAEGRYVGLMADLERRGKNIAAAAGEGVGTESHRGKRRARVVVRTETFDAILAESRDHTLSQALDAGR